MEKVKTMLYFIRHADSKFVEGKEKSRGLTEKGKLDAYAVKDRLITEKIDILISSSYERAIATIRPLAEELSKDILIEEGLRERAIGDFGSIPFWEAKEQVYTDFRFSFPAGEPSEQAQERAMKVILDILERYEGKRIGIGTHGDIMTLMLNFFDKQYDFKFWQSTSMPDIYQVEFEGRKLISCTRLWEYKNN